MWGYFKNFTLSNKILVLSFCITCLVIVTTMGSSIVLYDKQMKSQLTEHIEETAVLWGSTIETERLQKVIDAKDRHNIHFKKIHNFISLANLKGPFQFHTMILSPHISNKEATIIVASEGSEKFGYDSLSTIVVPAEFTSAMEKVVKTNGVANSEVFQYSSGTWISAFAPIINDDGSILAIFGIAADVLVIKTFQWKMIFYILIIYCVISALVYFLFKKGLNHILEPVNEIFTGINEVSNGNFKIKLKTHDRSDLGLLIDQFNVMTNHLSTVFERLTLTSEQLGAQRRKLGDNKKFENAINEMDHIIEKTKILKELQRAEKMNAIGQLAASVAHEIRNPMTVVKGFLQIFLSKEHLLPEEHMYIRIMIDEMNRAETIINDYLSLAKPDLDQLDTINFGKLTLSVTELMNSYAMMSNNIELKTDVQDDIWIKGNKSELKQVLINIFKNGIESMKDGGVLSIKVYKDDNFGIIEIEDTGIGMTVEELERLGTAFYSLKEKGTGIGLMVCYQIIDRMKGRIDVVSEKDKGTIFIIRIPLDSPPLEEME